MTTTPELHTYGWLYYADSLMWINFCQHFITGIKAKDSSFKEMAHQEQCQVQIKTSKKDDLVKYKVAHNTSSK